MNGSSGSRLPQQRPPAEASRGEKSARAAGEETLGGSFGGTGSDYVVASQPSGIGGSSSSNPNAALAIGAEDVPVVR